MTIEYIPKNRLAKREASAACRTCNALLHEGQVVSVPEAIRLARGHDQTHDIVISEIACGFGMW